jgi:hypothetical protein
MLAFFEIWEYLADITFDLHQQGVFKNGIEILSRIDDTMLDIILGAISSAFFAIFMMVSGNNHNNKA